MITVFCVLMSKVYMTAELSQNFAVATVANESSIEDKSAAKRVQPTTHNSGGAATVCNLSAVNKGWELLVSSAC